MSQSKRIPEKKVARCRHCGMVRRVVCLPNGRTVCAACFVRGKR